MERHLDTVHQRLNTVGDFLCGSGGKALQAEREADESTQNTKAGHDACHLIQLIAVNDRIHQFVIDVLFHITFVISVVCAALGPLDSVELHEKVVILLCQDLLLKQRRLGLLILIPQKFVRIHGVLADLRRHFIQFSHHLIHRLKTISVTCYKNNSYNDEH